MFIKNLIVSAFLATVAIAAPPQIPKGIIAPMHTAPVTAPITSLMGRRDIKYTMGHPVLTEDVNIYYIYYGNWSDSAKETLEHFANHVGNSSWYGINKKYYFQEKASSPKVYADGNVQLKGTVQDDYSLGKDLKNNALPEIIQSHIDAGRLPEDTSAVYFVLTSGDVKETIRSDMGRASFCSAYCGYHVSWKLKSGKRIFYSQAGYPSACMSGCAPSMNKGNSPNGDEALDALISVVAHELVEAVSDPESDGRRAWQDGTGYENADKCAESYGTTQRTSKGAHYNVELEGKNYLIQRNWDPETQACSNGV